MLARKRRLSCFTNYLTAAVLRRAFWLDASPVGQAGRAAYSILRPVGRSAASRRNFAPIQSFQCGKGVNRVFFFFSNGIGCIGSLLISAIATLILLAVLGFI